MDHASKYDGGNGQTKGNLVHKSDIGQLKYVANKAASALNIDYPLPPDQPPYVINLKTQAISYTSHHKARTISEVVDAVNHEVTYSYGPDQQRRTSARREQGQLKETRTYVGDYEKQVIDGVTREIHYVSGGDGLCAMLVREGVNTKLYYVFKDHLGSIIKVVEPSGFSWTVVAEQSFDAWGRRRKPSTWEHDDVPSGPSWLYRGYTGHEHVEPFRLINMNGRMYDPLNARMLSADNYIHGGSQGLNRYSYALNNPLKYVDPDGEHPLIVIGIMAEAGFYAGGAIAAGDGGLSGAQWNPGQWGGTDWYNGALIGLGAGALGGWGITALGPIAAGALYSGGVKGAGGLIASALGYGAVGALAGGAAGWATGYLTDRYVNGVPHGEAVNTGWDLAGPGAALGATVGMTYGLTPGGFERILPMTRPDACTLVNIPTTFPGNYPAHEWPSLTEAVRGFRSVWVDRTLWSTQTAVGTSIPGSTALQYALPAVPLWFGQPGFRGPQLSQSGTAPNFNLSFFYPRGGNPPMGLFGLFDFPWGGTYVNNNGIDVALTFRQRIQIPRRGRRFFGLFTIWR
ncbi:MAG TPA: RHS repeat-associated core domain-containing protein [Flavobacteriales bacterium]|nr:RHS repeat-associated core domain-containing protein [Flavobacteriales bacterium]